MLTESILWQRPTEASVCMFIAVSVRRRLKADDPWGRGGGGTLSELLTRFKLKVSTVGTYDRSLYTFTVERNSEHPRSSPAAVLLTPDVTADNGYRNRKWGEAPQVP